MELSSFLLLLFGLRGVSSHERRLGELQVAPETQIGITGIEGATFVEFVAGAGSQLLQDDPILTVLVDGEERSINTPVRGFVVDRAALQKGDALSGSMIVAVVVPPLKALGCQSRVHAPNVHGGMFKNYVGTVGDKVSESTSVYEITSKVGATESITSGIEGELQAVLELLPGQAIPSFATVALVLHSCTLKVGAGEFGLPMAEPAIFVQYLEVLGGYVSEGDNVAEVTVADETSYLTAPKEGYIVDMYPLLHGDEVPVRKDIVVIVPPIEPVGTDVETPATEDDGLFFQKYNTSIGDPIDEGVSFMEATDGPGNKHYVAAWEGGKVKKLLPLMKGQRVPPNANLLIVETEDSPWWILVLVTLLLCCVGVLALLCCREKERSPKEDAREMLIEPVAEEPEPVPEPVVVEPPPPPAPEGVRIDFQTVDGATVTKYFSYRPIGIIFNKRAPIELMDFHFNSYGETQGVQLGWVITRIGDEDVTGINDFNVLMQKLHDSLLPYPWWPLRAEFTTPSGSHEVIQFVKQPLGMTFSRQAPITISHLKPNSYAASVGVQEGWVLQKLGDVELQPDSNFKCVEDLLLDALSRLEPIPGLALLKTKSSGSFRSKSLDLTNR